MKTKANQQPPSPLFALSIMALAPCAYYTQGKIKFPVPASTAYALFPAGSHITHLSGRISPFPV